MPQTEKKSRRMALCGVLAALAAVLLSLGGIIPFATFCCPVLAMLCLIPVAEEFGTKTALLFYLAVALLGILLAPDKEVALLFAFLGYYPALRGKIDAKVRPQILNYSVKLAIFAAAVTVLYACLLRLLGMEELAQEYAAEGQAILALNILLGCTVWLLCDRVLREFTALYRSKWRRILFRA